LIGIRAFFFRRNFKHTLHTTMKTYKTVKRFPIIAGMPLDGNGSNKLREVGYYVKEFIFDSPEKDYLIAEKVIKRVFTH
jgi:hypothetical protein